MLYKTKTYIELSNNQLIKIKPSTIYQNSNMKNQLTISVCTFIILHSVSKVLGNGFETNRQAVIAGALTSVAVGILGYLFLSNKKQVAA